MIAILSFTRSCGLPGLTSLRAGTWRGIELVVSSFSTRPKGLEKSGMNNECAEGHCGGETEVTETQMVRRQLHKDSRERGNDCSLI